MTHVKRVAALFPAGGLGSRRNLSPLLRACVSFQILRPLVVRVARIIAPKCLTPLSTYAKLRRSGPESNVIFSQHELRAFRLMNLE